MKIALAIMLFAIVIDTTKSQPQPRKSIEKKGAPRYYICPIDESMLRVKVANPAATYKCPVDGATMRSGVGPNQQYWLLE